MKNYRGKGIDSCKKCGHISNDKAACRYATMRSKHVSVGETIPAECPLEEHG